MTATGARARALANLLTETRGWTRVSPPTPPRLTHLSMKEREAIRHLYDALGGNPEEFDRIRPGYWDLAFDTPSGALLVELDEEQHFNRYRQQTLDASGLGLPWAKAYLTYCRDHEHQLVPRWTTGKRWTNPSAARFFGHPSAPGDFTGIGAPRWRQRAFYDSFKDVTVRQRLARISVHDTTEVGSTVEYLLRRPTTTAGPSILDLVSRRTHNP